MVYLNPWPITPSQAYPESFSQHRSATVPHIQESGAVGALKGWVRRGILQLYGYKDLGNWPTAILGRIALLVPRLKLGATWGNFLIPRARNGGKVLDIGCGNGHFLAVLRMLGWDVYGIEPDPLSANLAKQLSEARISPMLQDAGFQSEFFDLITMNHALEHIGNPVQTLQECRPLLKRGGQIGIRLPSLKALNHRLFGKYWYALDPPRHLVMFEPATLKTLVEHVGFMVERVFTTSERQGRITFQKSWRYKHGQPPPGLFTSLWCILNILVSRATKEMGEELVLWGSKA